MKRSDRERLGDIADAIAVIRQHMARSRLDERLRRDAILYNLVVVGEAVKGLSDDTKAKRPEIPWRKISGLRDLLAHEYFQIEIDEIAKIVDRDLTPLEEAVAGLALIKTRMTAPEAISAQTVGAAPPRARSRCRESPRPEARGRS